MGPRASRNALKAAASTSASFSSSDAIAEPHVIGTMRARLVFLD
jgi:hypothetical protein